MDILKMEDTYENNKRLEQVRENKKKQFLDKIAETSQRLEQAQQEKERIFLERKKLQTQLETEKAETLKEFEKQKKVLIASHRNPKEPNLQLTSTSSLSKETLTRNMPNTRSTPKLAPIGENRFELKSGAYQRNANTTTRKSSEKPFRTDLSSEKISTVKNSTLSGSKSPYSVIPIKKNAQSPVIVYHKKAEKVDNVHNNNKQDSGAVSSRTLKEDKVISDLQTENYIQKSSSTRQDHLSQLVKAIDEALVNSF